MIKKKHQNVYLNKIYIFKTIYLNNKLIFQIDYTYFEEQLSIVQW